jgi:trimethylamine:corrinoid methyltransferase-like protein
VACLHEVPEDESQQWPDVHTAAHYRSQMWFPSLLDRNFFEIWDQQGRKETSDRIAERKNELLAKPAEVVIDPTTAKELDKIVADAERDLLKKT